MSIVQSLFLHFRDVVDRGDPDFVATAVGPLDPRDPAAFANPEASE
jgi:hypothetical protein